jgi:hypothetical protein
MTIIAAIISGLCGLFLGYHWGRRDEREDNPPASTIPDAPASVVAQGGGGPGIIK